MKTLFQVVQDKISVHISFGDTVNDEMCINLQAYKHKRNHSFKYFSSFIYAKRLSAKIFFTLLKIDLIKITMTKVEMFPLSFRAPSLPDTIFCNVDTHDKLNSLAIRL